MAIFDILVTVENSPTRVRGWGYLIEADNAEEAKKNAMEMARKKVEKPYSRYKKCGLVIKDKDVIEKKDW